ncbi:MAG TPA: xanthine phosphoribosyltransferase [Ruminococcaceae bacterium]|nr:xanthine phosphoribosyltransferase [Oscillospiraceae bacterium]
MKALEEKILREGKVLPGNILKVGGFLNHQIDTVFLKEMAQEVARLYRGSGVNKIVTVEASGIAYAAAIGMELSVPIVFAKKHRTDNLSGNVYGAMVHSYTHGQDYRIVIEKDCLKEDDRVLIADDFLALGNAIRGLIDIVGQAGAEVVGITTQIEKGFQGGGDELRREGYRVDSLAIIDSMENGTVRFRHQG